MVGRRGEASSGRFTCVRNSSSSPATHMESTVDGIGLWSCTRVHRSTPTTQGVCRRCLVWTSMLCWPWHAVLRGVTCAVAPHHHA
jgi:hypothetical protein